MTTPEYLRPSRREAAREAGEEWLADTYERRYLDWCRKHMQDPDDVRSVESFEEDEDL